MSASDPNSAIYVTDSAKEIKNKVGLSNVLLRTFSNKINPTQKRYFYTFDAPNMSMLLSIEGHPFCA